MSGLVVNVARNVSFQARRNNVVTFCRDRCRSSTGIVWHGFGHLSESRPLSTLLGLAPRPLTAAKTRHRQQRCHLQVSRRRFLTTPASAIDAQPDREEENNHAAKSPPAIDLLSQLPPTTQSSLRPYQLDVIRSCLSALDRGVTRMGVSSPTGSGKTVML